MRRRSQTVPSRALVAALLLGAMRGPAAEPAPPDWWRAQSDTTTALLTGQRDLLQWVAEVGPAKPADAQQALGRVGLLLRAGMNVEAVQALQDLHTLCPELESYQVSSLYYDAGDGFHAWEVAQAAVELFAAGDRDISLENRLLRHLLDTGWTVDQVDRWLAARPPGVDGFWVKERLRFASAHGRGEALATALADAVRAHPADIPGALTFLDALAGAPGSAGERPDLSWLVATLKPSRATEAADLGSRLQTLGDQATAVAFFQRATEVPLTTEDAERLAGQCQVAMSEGTAGAMFAARVREELATCLLGLGRNAEAQTWMVAATDLREKHGLGRNALLAGQVQAATGARAIEERVRGEEQTSADQPRYWQERARYYRGRNETAQEEEALRRGLALTTPKPVPERLAKGPSDERAGLLTDLARFLQRTERGAEAVARLREELASVPAEAASAQAAARPLAFDFRAQVNPTDEVLWTWLSNRPRWEPVEARLLWTLLENAPGAGREPLVTRAEHLAQAPDPSRAAALGEALTALGLPGRAVPLLERALRETPGPEPRDAVASALFRAYLDGGDWRRAEAVFPTAARRLTARETPEHLGRIAVCAARAGAPADALQIWSRVTNLDLTVTSGLRDLAAAGLREDLSAHYRHIHQALPTSTAPAAALKALTPPPPAP